MKTVEVRHPLVQHKIGLLRDAAQQADLVLHQRMADFDGLHRTSQRAWTGRV